MSNRTHLEGLLAQFAKAAGLPPLSLDEHARLHVIFRGTVDLWLEYDEPEQRIVLSARLGQPGGDDLESLFRQMLEVNAHWRELGGVTLGLDAESTDVLQFRSLFLGSLDYAAFEAALIDFADKAETWMELIREEATEADADNGSMPALVHPNLRA